MSNLVLITCCFCFEALRRLLLRRSLRFCWCSKLFIFIVNFCLIRNSRIYELKKKNSLSVYFGHLQGERRDRFRSIICEGDLREKVLFTFSFVCGIIFTLMSAVRTWRRVPFLSQFGLFFNASERAAQVQGRRHFLARRRPGNRQLMHRSGRGSGHCSWDIRWPAAAPPCGSIHLTLKWKCFLPSHIIADGHVPYSMT